MQSTELRSTADGNYRYKNVYVPTYSATFTRGNEHYFTVSMVYFPMSLSYS